VKTAIRPIGLLKMYCKERLDEKQRIDVAEKTGQSLADICRELGLPVSLISHYIVNGQPRSGDYLIQPGDDVKCLAVIGGG
jgi:sulfur carrier protein ThiS